MDAAAELGRNPVSKHQIQPEDGDEQADTGRDIARRAHAAVYPMTRGRVQHKRRKETKYSLLLEIFTNTETHYAQDNTDISFSHEYKDARSLSIPTLHTALQI